MSVVFLVLHVVSNFSPIRFSEKRWRSYLFNDAV